MTMPPITKATPVLNATLGTQSNGDITMAPLATGAGSLRTIAKDGKHRFRIKTGASNQQAMDHVQNRPLGMPAQTVSIKPITVGVLADCVGLCC